MSVRCTLCSVGLLGCPEDEPLAVVYIVYNYLEEILPKACKGLIRMRDPSPPIYKPAEIPFFGNQLSLLFCVTIPLLGPEKAKNFREEFPCSGVQRAIP